VLGKVALPFHNEQVAPESSGSKIPDHGSVRTRETRLRMGARERAEGAARAADAVPAGFALGRTEHFTEVILQGPAEPGAIMAAARMKGHDGGG
jgi:hypothetical protein